MTIIGIHSIAALKRALTVGTDVYVVNTPFPWLSGYRQVVARTGKSVQLSFPEGYERKGYTGSWVDFPARPQIRFIDETAHFLDDATAEPWLTLRVVQLTLDDSEEITQYYGCNCDMNDPCDIPQCLMEQDFELRSMGRWYRNQIIQGFDPSKTYAENVERGMRG